MTLLLVISIHVVRPNARSHFTAESNSARKAFSDAEHSLKLTRDEAQHADEDLLDLFDPEGFGVEGEWKKLDDLCISKDTGEYVSWVETA
jgi:protein kinase C substrate 80K-H